MSISRKSVLGVICIICIFAAGFLARNLVAPGALNLSPTVLAQEDRGSRRCSTRTLKGAYGVKFEGQKLGVGPFVSISRITFDGEGHFTTAETGRFNGALVQRAFTGPYTVNEDCTGFLDFSSNLSNPPHAAHGDFVIVNGGQKFFVVDSEDDWAANGIGEKQ